MKTVLTLTVLAAVTLSATQVVASPNPHTFMNKTATYPVDSCRKAHEIHRDKLKQMAAKHCKVVHKSILDRFQYRAEGCDFITRGKPPTLVIGSVRFSCK